LTRREWIVFSSIATNLSAIGDSTFKAPNAEDMKSKVALDQVIIGVEAFDTADKASKPFGKLDPNKYEVLPVLIVIKNNRKSPIKVGNLEVQYIVPGLGKVEALRANEVTSAAAGPTAPNLGPRPLPIPARRKKNPLAAPEIEGRAFAARMIAAGESASGFFYFNIKHRTTAKIYLNGLVDASTNQEIFYFEIPFND
jgi:hypothetical protein